jgi:hypothetical protein
MAPHGMGLRKKTSSTASSMAHAVLCRYCATVMYLQCESGLQCESRRHFKTIWAQKNPVWLGEGIRHLDRRARHDPAEERPVHVHLVGPDKQRALQPVVRHEPLVRLQLHLAPPK